MQTSRSVSYVHREFITVQVEDASGNVVPSQLNPVWSQDASPSSNEFELWFEVGSNQHLFAIVIFQVELPPLSLTTFYIKQDSPRTTAVAKVEVRGAEVKESRLSIAFYIF